MTHFLTSAALAASLVAFGAEAQQTFPDCTGDGWLEKSDTAFAEDCADMAFSDSLVDRQRIAWMIFTRVNQLIAAEPGRGISGSDTVPLWMAWATDPDTFDQNSSFTFNSVPRTAMAPSIDKRLLNAGIVNRVDPNSSNEETMRNQISHDYLINAGLTTMGGVEEFFGSKGNQAVDMPIGSVELKGSWLQVTPGSPAPAGAITLDFESGPYWLRGLHIMVKMRKLDAPFDIFYSEDPSWFWATFEFNNNTGTRHVRETFITQRAPLPIAEIEALLKDTGLDGIGLENYAPNGTQIRFTVDGTGETPVILGHTDMEDFAGAPNTAQPRYWTSFQASCHSCHASASFNPDTNTFFPFTVPTGALDPGYNDDPGGFGVYGYLGQGFLPLDFMWPIAYFAK